jgi:hypothetical protein
MRMGGNQCQTLSKISNFYFQNQQLWGEKNEDIGEFSKKSKHKGSYEQDLYASCLRRKMKPYRSSNLILNKISESNVYLMMVYIDEFVSNLHSHSPYC